VYTLTYLQNGQRYRIEIWCTDAQWQFLKTRKENVEKWRGLGHVTPVIFGVHLNVSTKQIELET